MGRSREGFWCTHRLRAKTMQNLLDAKSGQRAASGALPRCVLLSTGGTIASRIDPATGLAVPALSADDLLAALPELNGRIDVDVEDFSRVPSPHIGPEHWTGLHARIVPLLADEGITGVVVSHGTGLLEETAWFLDLTLSSDKPVVIVGAQRNNSERDYDGSRNLLNALQACVHPMSRGKGVLVVLNQHINAAREVHKTHTFDVETFNSGEWGFLGNVTADEVVFHRTPSRRLHMAYDGRALPRVDVIPMYAGASGTLIKAAVADGAQGIVIQAVGSGHVNPGFASSIRDVLRSGIPVVVATRVPRGGTRACYGFEGSSRLLQDDGAALAGDLSAWKARIVLMLAMAEGDASQATLRVLLGT